MAEKVCNVVMAEDIGTVFYIEKTVCTYQWQAKADKDFDLIKIQLESKNYFYNHNLICKNNLQIFISYWSLFLNRRI